MTFEEATLKAIGMKKALVAANLNGNEEEERALADEFSTLVFETWNKEGQAFAEIMREYAISLGNGNVLMNLYTNFGSVSSLREFGIKKFTVIANSSETGKFLTRLVREGYKVIGTDRICTRRSRWYTDFEDVLVLELPE